MLIYSLSRIKRTKVGIIFSNDENWIGGTYYILNLINALKTLPDTEKPIIVILSTAYSDYTLALKTDYPYLNYKYPEILKRNYAEVFINKCLRFITGRDWIKKGLKANDVDVIFPARFDGCYKEIKRKIFWFPDFQHLHYPQYFTSNEIQERNTFLYQVSQSSNILVLSSLSAKKDWENNYPSRNCEIVLMPFSVSHPDIGNMKIDTLLLKYSLPKQYFLISNQFWQHKNHFLILRAVKALKDMGYNYAFVFTGKHEDYRRPHYFKELESFVKQNEITALVHFLGLIDRKEQLVLMKHAKAVIQPSLFEGWSSVIEDAKYLNVPLLVSDIDVHREQLPYADCFFNPHDERDLLKKIFALEEVRLEQREDYIKNVKSFALNFKNIVGLALKNIN